MEALVAIAVVPAAVRGRELRARFPDIASYENVSVSHTTGLSVMAGSAARVGIDVEVCRRRPFAERLAARTMTPLEREHWRAAGATSDALTLHWTRVEAYLKAIGTGVRGGYLTRPGDGWSVIDLDLDPAPGHVGSIALECTHAVITMRWAPVHETSR